MNWDDVNDILFDGTKEQILNLRCPDCGEQLQFQFYLTARVFPLRCIGECGHVELSNKCYKIPNCVKFFGNSSSFGAEVPNPGEVVPNSGVKVANSDAGVMNFCAAM